MSNRLLNHTLAACALAFLAACSGDPVSPTADVALRTPSSLIAPNEFTRIVSDSVDAYGNTILVQEFGMGFYTLPNGDGASVASVTIRSSIPGSPGAAGTSGACITHSIVQTETTPGNTLTVKKAGGCDRDVVILIEQKATRRKATFSFSMVFGKTVIDAGELR
jgi:hypothetical protein